MLNLAVPWWELILRSAIVYAALLLILRVTGKRQVGQLAPFDLVLLLVLSNAVQNSMNGGDNSLIGGLISLAAGLQKMAADNLVVRFHGSSNKTRRVADLARSSCTSPMWRSRNAASQ